MFLPSNYLRLLSQTATVYVLRSHLQHPRSCATPSLICLLQPNHSITSSRSMSKHSSFAVIRCSLKPFTFLTSALKPRLQRLSNNTPPSYHMQYISCSHSTAASSPSNPQHIDSRPLSQQPVWVRTMSFLGLLPEIRNTIYEILFQRDKPIHMVENPCVSYEFDGVNLLAT